MFTNTYLRIWMNAGSHNTKSSKQYERMQTYIAAQFTYSFSWKSSSNDARILHSTIKSNIKCNCIFVESDAQVIALLLQQFKRVSQQLITKSLHSLSQLSWDRFGVECCVLQVSNIWISKVSVQQVGTLLCVEIWNTL